MKDRLECFFLIVMLAAGLAADIAMGGQPPFAQEESAATEALSLTSDEIQSVKVTLLPPDVTIALTAEEIQQLVNLLQAVVLGEADHSYQEYEGQSVTFEIEKKDKTSLSIMEYAPFLVIDGNGYRTEYEPCEALNQFGNQILAAAKASGVVGRLEQPGGGEETDWKEAEEADRPPMAELITTDGNRNSCTYATLGTYEWNIARGDQNEGITACSSPPTQWEEIAVILQDETDGRITLRLSPNMVEYAVCYWVEGATCGVADPVTMEGDTILLDEELGRGTYELYVKYQQGEAYYGFRVE